MLSALDLCAIAIQGAYSMFVQILDGVDGTSVWFSAMLLWLTYRLLFKRLFGLAGSDVAKRSYNAFKNKRIKDGD